MRPPGCEMEKCDYYVTWSAGLHIMNVKLSARINVSQWTGIGFAQIPIIVKFSAPIFVQQTYWYNGEY